MPTLIVVLTPPVNGNVHHWSLHLETIGVYDVYGDPTQFTFRFIHDKARLTPEAITKGIYVCEIDDIKAFDRQVRETPVRNDIVLWNCQNYVLDVLASANEEGLIPDWEYAEASQKLEEVFHK